MKNLFKKDIEINNEIRILPEIFGEEFPYLPQKNLSKNR